MKQHRNPVQTCGKGPRTRGVGVRPRVPDALRGFGMNEILGIAAGLIIAGIVVIPGLRGVAGTMLTQLETWWSSLASGLFTP